MRILLFAALTLVSFDLSGQCADAGRDTLTCGFRYVLTGQPAGGTWSYICTDSTRWLELGGTTPNGNAVSLVSECGEYQFVYTVNDTSCMDADTVTVRYENDSEQTRTISYDIDIQYGNHDCPGFPYDSCGHIRVFPGVPPPNPRWFINLTGECDADYIDPIVSSRDSSTCLATINYVAVDTRDTVETLWTSTQDPFLSVDKLNREITNERFDQFLRIIEGGLMNGLDSACFESQKCYVEDDICVDTIYDTIQVILPVHYGGRWGLIDTSGVIPLEDTTDFVYFGESYRLIIATGARNFGPGDLQFELYKRNQANNTIDLDTTLDLTFFWEEDWGYDTTMRVFPRYIPNGNCVTCGFTEVMYDTLIFPDFPTTFCPTIALQFNPPLNVDIAGDRVICEDGNTVLSGPPGYDRYEWSNGTMSLINFIVNPGVYTLTVTDSAGCQATNSVEIIQREHADYEILYDSTLFCENNCANFIVSGTGIRTFIWDNGQDDTTAIYCFSLDDDFITVELTDTNNCIFNDTIFLDIQPTDAISAGPDMQLTCNQPTITLSPDSAALANTSFFRWTGPGINAGNEFAIKPVVDQPGAYVLANGPDSLKCLGRDTVMVRLFDERPNVAVSDDDLINCEDENVTISGMIVGNDRNTSFFWEGPGITAQNRNDEMVTTDQPGTYVFIGCNDITGCCTRDTVAIGLNKNQPTADAGPDKIITCDTTAVSLGGGGSSSGFDIIYQWSGPGIDIRNQDVRFPTVREEGTYTVRVIDTVSKCVAIDMVTVTNRGNVPVSNAGVDQILTCVDSVITLSNSGSTSGSGIGFIWEGPGITAQNERSPSPMVMTPGTYVLTVRDTLGNCESMDTVIVTQEMNFPDIDAGMDLTLDCNVRNFRLLGRINNDNGRMTAMWEGPGILPGQADTLVPTINEGGIYILTVIDELSQCKSKDTAVITEDFDPAMLDVGADDDINCLQDSVFVTPDLTNYDSLSFQFIWEINDPGIPAQNVLNLNQRIGDPGTYVAMVLASNERCNVFDTITIGVDTIPPVIDAGSDRGIGCNGDSVILELTSNVSLSEIEWTTDDGVIEGSSNNMSVTVSAEGTYVVTVIGENGCMSLDSVMVIGAEDVEIVVVPNSIMPTCGDMNTGQARVGALTGALPIMYSLNGSAPSTTNSFTGLSAGTYTVVGIDANGCTDTLTFEIESIDTFEDVPRDTVIKVNLCDSIDMVAIIGEDYGYPDQFITWLDAPGTQIRRSVEEPGEYRLQFSSACDTAIVVYDVSTTMITENRDSVLTMPKAFTPNGDGSNDVYLPKFVIDPDNVDFDQYRLVIYNRWGNQVFESTDPLTGWDGTQNGEEAPSEVYLFRLFVGDVMDCSGNRVVLEPWVGDVTLIR